MYKPIGGQEMKKDKNLMVRVSGATHEALKKKATSDGTTMSEVVRHFIDLYLQGKITPPKKP